MIWNFFISIIVLLVNAVLTIMPVMTSDTSTFLNSNITAFNQALWGSDWIIPVGTLTTTLWLVMTTEALIIGIKISEWGFSLISGGLYKRYIK